MMAKSGMLRRNARCVWYGVKTLLLRRQNSYLFTLIIGDACNLSCFYCLTKNTGHYDLDFAGVLNRLRDARTRGHQALAISGGEPMVWQSDGRTVEDVVREARALGFGDVTVFTNGTFPLVVSGCRYIVTVDGPPSTHNRIRPDTYYVIMRHVRDSDAEVFASITISKQNVAELEETIQTIYEAGVFKGIMFNLLTGQPQMVEQFGLLGKERLDVLQRIWVMKQKGYPIILSRAAYRAFCRNDWKRPISQVELGTRSAVYTCCRAVGNPEICANCGYSGCVEISQAIAGRPSAILSLLRAS
jgi:MoaA/NifB/PqqE/SkfB family radical SAM enzyme